MMKTKILIYGMLFFMTACFIACENGDNDNQKPTISNLEVGHDDTAHAGDHLHVEFEVTDNDALEYYNIEIHTGDEHNSTGDSWVFDSTFTEVGGLKNSLVHHDIILVPERAEEGDYHFMLTVADEAGNTASEERDLVLSHNELVDDDH